MKKEILKGKLNNVKDKLTDKKTLVAIGAIVGGVAVCIQARNKMKELEDEVTILKWIVSESGVEDKAVEVFKSKLPDPTKDVKGIRIITK